MSPQGKKHKKNHVSIESRPLKYFLVRFLRYHMKRLQQTKLETASSSQSWHCEAMRNTRNRQHKQRPKVSQLKMTTANNRTACKTAAIQTTAERGSAQLTRSSWPATCRRISRYFSRRSLTCPQKRHFT